MYSKVLNSSKYLLFLDKRPFLFQNLFETHLLIAKEFKIFHYKYIKAKNAYKVKFK